MVKRSLENDLPKGILFNGVPGAWPLREFEIKVCNEISNFLRDDCDKLVHIFEIMSVHE